MGMLVVVFAPLFALMAPFQLAENILESSISGISEIFSLWSTYFA